MDAKYFAEIKARLKRGDYYVPYAPEDIMALIAEVERLTAENQQNADYAEIYKDICDKYGKNFRALLDKAEAYQAENAQLRAGIEQTDPDFFKKQCRICGCDWNHPCNDHDFWVEDDLCSVCAKKMVK